MRALLRKELALWVPAVLVALVLSGIWILVWTVPDVLLSPGQQPLTVVAFLALNAGAILGFVQITTERSGETLSYLVHRDVGARRVFAAKCVAGWILLGIVVHVPLVLFALWERFTSPIGELIQWGRLGELALIGLAGAPAHALGALCATLRPELPWRILIGSFAAGGLGALLALFLENPVVGPGPSTLLFLGFLLAITVALLVVARRRLLKMEDPDRPPRAGTLATLLVVFVGGIVLPGHAVLSLVQDPVLRAAVSDRAGLAWHPERGVARFEHRDGGWEGTNAAGEVIVPVSEGVEGHRLTYSSGDWSRLWHPDGRWAGHREPGQLPPSRKRGTPAIAPAWQRLVSHDYDGEYSGSKRAVTAWLDRQGGELVVLEVPEVGAPVLRRLRSPDGESFARASAFPTADGLIVGDPYLGKSWSLALDEPGAELQPHAGDELRPTNGFSRDALLVGRYLPSSHPTAVAPAEARAHVRVRVEVEGDRLSCIVRVRESETGAVIFEQPYRIEGYGDHQAAAFLYGTSLLRGPATLLLALVREDDPRSSEPRILGSLVGGTLIGPGRGLLLIAASLALTLWVLRGVLGALRRRGAERWRRVAWSLAVLIGGPAVALAYAAFEPPARAIAAPAPARARATRPVIQSNGATA